MLILISAIVFLILISFLFFTHEFGHFLMAKIAKVPVLEFGFGFPPAIFKWKWKETVYSLNAIPFGAFVKVLGMENPKEKDPRAYWNQSVFKRLLISVGGIVSNFFWAWFILTLCLWLYLFVPMKNHIIISEVQKGSPAEVAGLKEGDIVIKGNGTEFTNSKEVRDFTHLYQNQKVSITIMRFGKKIEKEIVLREGEAPLGIAMLDTSLESKIPFWRAPFVSALILGQGVYLTASYLGKLIISPFTKEKVSVEIGGPVAIWGYVSQFINLSWLFLLRLCAFLSLGLGFFNLLPLPALDGGRIAFLAGEGIFGKKVVTPEKENTIHTIGFIFLLLLSVLIAYNDIVRILKK